MSAVKDQRTAELATIHVGKKQLGLDDETYRDMLWTVARVRSAKDLDHKGRREVIEHMRARGFARLAPEPVVNVGKAPVFSEEKQALGRKIGELLEAGGYPWNYARAMASRMFKIDALEFATPAQLHSLVAALEYDKKRRSKRAP